MMTIRVNFTRSCFEKTAIFLTIYFLLVYKYYQYPDNQIKLFGKMEKGNKYYKYNYIEALAIHPDTDPHNSSQLLINLTDFTFLHNNPNICYKNRLYNQLLLVLVHSARSHLEERYRIRQILGSFKTIKGWDIRLAFILGKKSSSSGKEYFTLESTDDLIVGNFEDTYQNLTYKHAMTYKWTVEFCPDAKFLAKIDDDVYINFVDYLQEIRVISNSSKGQNQMIQPIIACTFNWISLPLREIKYKNRVSFQEYSGNFYPPYCPGAGYLASMSAVKIINKSAMKTKYFVVDDIVFTGFLREENKIDLKRFNFKSYKFFRRVNYTRELHLEWRTKFARDLYLDEFKLDLTIRVN